ncbi:MAG: hypothetical protein H5T34_04985 [Candidatus Methanomethyliales bacterium]|nr:hypothetical protein [Candidatus Methanomethylicales archaeon]
MLYEEFKEKLAKSSWDEKIGLAIVGIVGNVITKCIEECMEQSLISGILSLETIRIRFPDLYEVVKDEPSRDALVIIGLFDAYKGPYGEPMLALSSNVKPPYTFRGFPILPAANCVFEGKDALKAFLKSIYILYDEVRSSLMPVQADPFRPNIGKEEEAAKLEATLKEVVKGILKNKHPNEKKLFLEMDAKKISGIFVYNLYDYGYPVLSKVRKRLSKLIGEEL